jgi:hypothetical protein
MDKVRIMLCVMGLVVLCVALVSAQETREPKPDKSLLLIIAVDLDAPATDLIFEACNAGDKDIRTTPIGTSHNWLEVQRPDGKTEKIQEMIKIAQPIVIKAGESRTWHYDLAPQVKFDVVGQYRVTWHLRDISPAQLGAWKAEIVLVKSKGGPVDK